MQVESNVQMHFGTCKYAENEHAEQNLKSLFCILYKNYTHKHSHAVPGIIQWWYNIHTYLGYMEREYKLEIKM